MRHITFPDKLFFSSVRWLNSSWRNHTRVCGPTRNLCVKLATQNSTTHRVTPACDGDMEFGDSESQFIYLVISLIRESQIKPVQWIICQGCYDQMGEHTVK
jgi:hypothetical protein